MGNVPFIRAFAKKNDIFTPQNRLGTKNLKQHQNIGDNLSVKIKNPSVKIFKFLYVKKIDQPVKKYLKVPVKTLDCP